MKFHTGLSLLVLALGACADDAWTNPDGDNTHVDIGDKRISYGYAPPWYALDKIKEECPNNGCNSENKIEYPTGVIQDGDMLGASLIISVEGSFNDPGETGNRDDLVEIAKAVMGASPYEYEADAVYWTGNGCGTSGFTPCDPGNKGSADQYKASDLIVIRVEKDDGALLADMSISITIDVDDAVRASAPL
ncbi:hypothetical protein QQX98_012640 [Neonectria punicea]|uniref:Uncharacterized protein n=1 Tax=Neonectria punicea TaxID=979145 RepID=A0ABR1GI93_9HYPO